jgi:flagella basal body P-ring formation protein FlgA
MSRAQSDVRQTLRRIVARHAAFWLACAAAGAWTTPAALADSGSAIVIPGPGEQNPADLARMKAMATSGSTRAPAVSANPHVTFGAVSPQGAPDRFSAMANQNGAIVIPGPGERPAGVANNAGLTRVDLDQQMVASQVTPVIVNAGAPATVRRAAYALPSTAAAPQAASAELDSLTSRGEPPMLAASGASTPPPAAAPRLMAAAAPGAARGAMPAVPFQAHDLEQANQRAKLVQALQAMQAHATPAAAQRVAAPMSVAAARQAQAGVQTGAQAWSAAPTGQEDGNAIRAAALAFLQQQAVGLPGQVSISVRPAFPRGLAACDALQPFMPSGARLWGQTTVGVRCTGAHPWTVWLQAHVSIHATYYVATHTLAPGEVVSAADIIARDGDLTMLPMSIVTAPSQAIGAVALMRVGAGLPLRLDMLRNAAQVTAGQMVRVVAQGAGFSISAEGSALSNAQPGQPVRVKTANGQIIMGIVKDSSTVEIQM